MGKSASGYALRGFPHAILYRRLTLQGRNGGAHNPHCATLHTSRLHDERLKSLGKFQRAPLGTFIRAPTKLSYDVNNASERYARLDVTVRELENERFSYQQEDEYFPKTGELERVQQRYEAQAEQLNQLVLDMQHCHRLVTKSVELGRAEMVDSKLQLATNGTIADLGFALKETQSEMHQIEVVCENAVFYPEIDARQAVLRRSHLLDLMFDLNGRAPIFYKLNEEQQHIAGNAVMKLIKARAGSLDSAVEFVEGHRQLVELGLVGGDFDSVLQGVSGKEALKALTYDFEAGTIGDSAGERSDAS